MTDPLGRKSIALGLHPSSGEASAAIQLLRRQAAAAEAGGFDGVTLSEHHGGFPNYLPVPALLSGHLLASTGSVWAAPCPAILTLRSRVATVEELAWLAAAYPRRVGAGFVSGYQQRDFTIYELGDRFAARRTHFAGALPWVTAALRGEVDGPLSLDPAIAALRAAPVPVLSGVGGPRGAAAAARAGAGLLLTSAVAGAQARALIRVFRGAGGTAPCHLIRRVWLGEVPASISDQLASYAREDTSRSLSHGRPENAVLHGSASRTPDIVGRSSADVRTLNW